ncbi:LuxR C-terminal-related transcriptional regulator [Microvirga brassicacearum]|uniref:Response regulator transcription factor n=1 Tax=Microvirga brassicacearum TaxID=2580413 RepID=A0A5N3PDC2_9HYPH|nr:response regulator transcription factor [Microvirga brassicacearum]KAB0267738.1 response regulator transcription factor [Microvirga brassicacearum]
MSQGELKVTTYLVCANPMLRAGLGHILANTRYEVSDQDKPISHEGQGGDESQPVMFIIDSNLKDAVRPASISALKERYPTAHVVILADVFSLEQMMAALKGGADGYCLPTVEALIRYLDLVMLGETAYPSAEFLSAVLNAQSRIDSDISRPADMATRRSLAQASDTRMLSNREAEILHCLMQGAPNKIIARQLDVAEATVKVHVKAILRKIQVANRTQAAMWAVEHFAPMGAEDAGAALR